MSDRVIIIGGGVIGLATAYYARLRGRQVTVVERRADEREGCSYGNAGLVVPSHFIPLAAPGVVAQGLKWMLTPTSPFYIKPRLSWALVDWAMRFWRAATPGQVARAAPVLRDLNLASRECYAQLNAVLHGSFGFAQDGLLMLCKTQHGLEAEAAIAEQGRQLGVAAQVLDARQTAEREPRMTFDIAGAVFFPQDGCLVPRNFMSSLQNYLRAAGVEFLWNTEVTGWRASAQRIDAVQTSSGELTANDFVLCAGAWSRAIVRDLGLRLPLEAGKGYSLTLLEPRQLPRIPMICVEARFAVTPLGAALRFAGTMELAGLQERINPRRVQGILRAVPRYFPEFSADDFSAVKPWCGLRPCSPDGLPYVGRSGRFNNLLFATGHSMLGMSLGPITGRLISEILAGEPPSIDVGPLSPDRYRRG